DTPGELSDEDLRTARLVAGVMTAALMALPPGEEDDGRPDGVSWLDGLDTGHDRIQQAIGMIMVQLGIGSDEALARLRGDAFARGRTAQEAAEDVLARRQRMWPDE
ncbi:ANTAR domain-containing protein, partial [Streptomyces sp. TRM76130]|nr:ANTAR domain-containing protein [Streptomyces sp. TRM76130]